MASLNDPWSTMAINPLYPTGTVTATTGNIPLSGGYAPVTSPTLVEKIQELEDSLKKKSHIDVAKDQEERICKIEEAITEMLDTMKGVKAWVERREEERCAEIAAKQMQNNIYQGQLHSLRQQASAGISLTSLAQGIKG